MAVNKEEKLREELLRGAQEIYKKGLVEDGEGNISVRLNKNEILVTPTSTNYEPIINIPAGSERRRYNRKPAPDLCRAGRYIRFN